MSPLPTSFHSAAAAAAADSDVVVVVVVVVYNGVARRSRYTLRLRHITGMSPSWTRDTRFRPLSLPSVRATWPTTRAQTCDISTSCYTVTVATGRIAAQRRCRSVVFARLRPCIPRHSLGENRVADVNRLTTHMVTHTRTHRRKKN